MTATPAPTPDGQVLEARLVAFFDEHAIFTPRGYANECCHCGWESDLEQPPEGQADAHLAAVLAPVVAAEVERAVGEAELRTLRYCTDLYCDEDKALIKGWADALAARVVREGGKR